MSWSGQGYTTSEMRMSRWRANSRRRRILACASSAPYLPQSAKTVSSNVHRARARSTENRALSQSARAGRSVRAEALLLAGSVGCVGRSRSQKNCARRARGHVPVVATGFCIRRNCGLGILSSDSSDLARCDQMTAYNLHRQARHKYPRCRQIR